MKLLLPATTANLGPGFDTLGLALKLYNEVTITTNGATEPTFEILGEGANSLPCDRHHLLFKAFESACRRSGKSALGGLEIRQLNRLPLARGLGSSAATTVAGVVAAKKLVARGVDVVAEATFLESHPDNVAPCFLGGLVASCQTPQGTLTRQLPIHLCWQVALSVPAFELSTEASRRVLPEHYSRSDAVFNLSRVPLLLHGLAEGDSQLVRETARDLLHQPYRLGLIPGAEEVMRAALGAGAAAAYLSGSGPTLAALVDTRQSDPAAVAEAMSLAFERHEIPATSLALEVDRDGCRQVD